MDFLVFLFEREVMALAVNGTRTGEPQLLRGQRQISNPLGDFGCELEFPGVLREVSPLTTQAKGLGQQRVLMLDLSLRMY